MPKGPKPKPEIICCRCGRKSKPKRDIYCSSCYSFAIRHGLINTLPKYILPNQLTKIQEEVLIGSMLGDGCLYKDKPQHKPYLSLGRSAIDKDYALWEADIFKDFISRIDEKSIFDKRTQKYYHSIKPISRRCEVFEKYYQLWYPNHKKIVPSNLELNPLSLAVWFADDGCITTPNSKHRFLLKLSTHGFSVEEVKFLCELLSNRYNEYFGLTLGKDKKPVIYSADSGSREFLKEIDPVFPPGIERKIKWRNSDNRFYKNQPEKSYANIKNRSLLWVSTENFQE